MTLRLSFFQQCPQEEQEDVLSVCMFQMLLLEWRNE